MIRCLVLSATLSSLSCQPAKIRSADTSTSKRKSSTKADTNAKDDSVLSKSIFTNEQSQKMKQEPFNKDEPEGDRGLTTLVGPEEIRTYHMCADCIAERWSTIKDAVNGIAVRLYPPSANNGADDAEGIDLNLSIKDSLALRDEIMSERRMNLSFADVPDGIYELVVCAKGAKEACTRPNRHYYGEATAQDCSFNYLSSQLGITVDESNADSGCKYMSVLEKAMAGAPRTANIGFTNPELIAVEDHQLVIKPEAILYYDHPPKVYPGTYYGSPATLLQFDPVNGCNSLISPLLVDLDRSGISLSSPLAGIEFDIDADGRKEKISWPKAGRGSFLVLDLNGDGSISNGSELFGDHSNGRQFLNGFDALAQYDDNRDGIIDERDPVFAHLRLWSDVNENAETDPGELANLENLNITAIELRYLTTYDEDIYGNVTRQRSIVHLQSGEVLVMFDVWFRPI